MNAMIEFLKKKKAMNSDKGTIVSKSTREENLEERIVAISDAFINNCHYDGNSIVSYSFVLLSALSKEKEISQGAFYINSDHNGEPVLKFLSGYATPDPDNIIDILEIGEGIPGQVAKDGRLINISEIPDDCFKITSGLGKAYPASLIAFPVKSDDKVLAVIELASFRRFDDNDAAFFEMISPMIANQILILINKSNN